MVEIELCLVWREWQISPYRQSAFLLLWSNKSCSPLPAYCGVNGQHSLKKGMDARKRWDWERKRKIEWSHSHVVVYSTYEWSYWMIWKPHDGVIHLKLITDSVLLENTGWLIMELTWLIFSNLMDSLQLFLSHLMPVWCNSFNIIPCSIA